MSIYPKNFKDYLRKMEERTREAYSPENMGWYSTVCPHCGETERMTLPISYAENRYSWKKIDGSLFIVCNGCK